MTGRSEKNLTPRRSAVFGTLAGLALGLILANSHYARLAWRLLTDNGPR